MTRFLEEVCQLFQSSKRPEILYWLAEMIEMNTLDLYSDYAGRIVWFYKSFYQPILTRLKISSDKYAREFESKSLLTTIAQVKVVGMYLTACFAVYDRAILTSRQLAVQLFTDVISTIEGFRLQAGLQVNNLGILLSNIYPSAIVQRHMIRAEWQGALGNKLVELYLYQDLSLKIDKPEGTEKERILARECEENILQEIHDIDPEGTLEKPPQEWLLKRQRQIEEAEPKAIGLPNPMYQNVSKLGPIIPIRLKEKELKIIESKEQKQQEEEEEKKKKEEENISLRLKILLPD